jgi:hypothetical protein
VQQQPPRCWSQAHAHAVIFPPIQLSLDSCPARRLHLALWYWRLPVPRFPPSLPGNAPFVPFVLFLGPDPCLSGAPVRHRIPGHQRQQCPPPHYPRLVSPLARLYQPAGAIVYAAEIAGGGGWATLNTGGLGEDDVAAGMVCRRPADWTQWFDRTQWFVGRHEPPSKICSDALSAKLVVAWQVAPVLEGPGLADDTDGVLADGAVGVFLGVDFDSSDGSLLLLLLGHHQVLVVRRMGRSV